MIFVGGTPRADSSSITIFMLAIGTGRASYNVVKNGCTSSLGSTQVFLIHRCLFVVFKSLA